MLHRNWKLAVLPLVLLAAAGCAGRRCLPCLPTGNLAPSWTCSRLEQPGQEVDVSLVSAITTVTEQAGGPYCELAEQDVACLAAARDSAAQLLDAEIPAIFAQPVARHQEPAVDLLGSALRRLAEYRRNEAAADGLELFLRLAEAEAGAANLKEQVVHLEAMLADLQTLSDRGLVTPVPRSDIDDQRLKLLHRLVELHATIDSLRVGLTYQLGLEQSATDPIWPVADLRVDLNVEDVETVYQRALLQRGDMAALQLVASSSDDQIVLAARALLSQSHAALGIELPDCLATVLAGHQVANEAAIRRAQAVEQLAERQRAVRIEIEQAVSLIGRRLDQIGLTRRRLEVAEQHLEALEQQRALTAELPLSVREARAQVLAIHQDLVHDVVQWKLAVIQLRKAEGALATSCVR